MTSPRSNSFPRLRPLAAVSAVLFVLSTGFAQQAAPGPAAPEAGRPATAAGEDIVVLSPFVVNTSDDVGYQASSSLAGIGLNTKLTDIGSTVSVITSQFMQDTASTDLRQLLLYQTSAESTGFGGNLSGADPTPGGIPSEPSLGNGNAGTRLRGLAAADNARNYFKSIIPMDSYNTDRVEINRGANALLFGVGSPAGIINTSTTTANLFRPGGDVEFSTGSYGSTRESFNFNIVPLKAELAIDVAGLVDDTKFQQQFTYSKSHREYATFSWDIKEFRDKGIFSSTTLNASYENGHIESNRPRALTPADRYSSWFPDTLPANLKALGATPYTSYDPTGLNNGSFSSFNSFTAANHQATIGVIDNVNRAPVYYFQNVNTTVPSYSAPNNPLAGGQALYGGPAVLDNFRFPATTRTINGVATAIPARTGIAIEAFSRDLARVRSDFGLKDAAFYTSNQMNDPSVFDFFNHTLIGPNSEAISNLQAVNASLQQLMFNRKFGVELSYDRQNWDESLQSLLPSNTPYISIDVNTYLWTGEKNPNYGRPFISTPGSASYTANQLDTRRAKAFYELDLQEALKNRLGWILGKHVFSALWQNQLSYADVRSGGSVFYTPDVWAPGSGQSRGSNTGKRVSTWVYLGAPGTSYYGAPSLSGANLQGLQQSLFNLPETTDGNGVLLTRLRAATAAQGQLAAYQPYTTGVNLLREDREVTNTAGSATLSRSNLDSKAASLQSNWLGDNLVSTIGLRRETNTALSALAPFDPNGEGYVLVNDPSYRIIGRDPSLPALVPQEYSENLFSWSGVAKTPQAWLKHLPKISALNAYYGYSENFQPASTQVVSAFGDPIPPPQGNTREVGIYVEAFDGLISARLNYFDTNQINVVNSNVANIPATIMQANASAFNLVATGAVPHPAGTTPSDAAYYYPAGYILPPQVLLNTFKYSITPNNSGYYNLNYTNPGVQDTSDYNTKGAELEVMLKPARGLSFTFNLAKVEAVSANTGAYARKLLYNTPTSTGAPLAVEWLKPWASQVPLALGSVNNLGTSDQFILNNYFQANVLNPFNTAALSDGSPSTELRKWRANFVSRYVFQAGRLKGFEAGAGVRWQSKAAIGFPVTSYHVSLDSSGKTVLTPVGSTSAQASDVRGYDVQHPFYGPDETRLDLWLAYQTKILHNKIGLRVQLNVRNVGISDRLVPIRINPDGSAASWEIAEGQIVNLTTRFSF